MNDTRTQEERADAEVIANTSIEDKICDKINVLIEAHHEDVAAGIECEDDSEDDFTRGLLLLRTLIERDEV